MTEPDKSWAMHEEMINIAQDFYKEARAHSLTALPLLVHQLIFHSLPGAALRACCSWVCRTAWSTSFRACSTTRPPRSESSLF